MTSETKKTVLLVDDEKHIIRQVFAFFRSIPAYELIITADPKKVESVLKGARIELVITDLRMPNVSGYDIIRMAAQAQRKIPFIVITAYKRQEAPRLGAMNIADGDIVEKPFEPEDLEKKIREKLGIREQGPAGPGTVVTNSAKIIFIDDEKDLADVFKETFEEEGFNVDTFSNGKAALEHLRGRAGEYHVAIVDIGLPGGVNGYELILEIRKLNAKIGIIPISANYPPEVLKKLKEIGFDTRYFLTKPFDDVPALMEMVREFAARAGTYNEFN
jgi:DNA-binding response OmpR family regulator